MYVSALWYRENGTKSGFQPQNHQLPAVERGQATQPLCSSLTPEGRGEFMELMKVEISELQRPGITQTILHENKAAGITLLFHFGGGLAEVK